MDEIIVLVETIFQRRICTTIPPEKKDTINQALKDCGLNESGTTNGWVLDESIEPVPCAEIPGRWHYMLIT